MYCEVLIKKIVYTNPILYPLYLKVIYRLQLVELGGLI